MKDSLESIALTVGLAFITSLSGSPALADVITPELEQQNLQFSSLQSAVAAARKSGNFDQQLAAAKALERFCLRTYYPYGMQNLSARFAMADIYWTHKEPAQAERLLSEFLTNFEQKYNSCIKKMALAEKQGSSGLFQSDPEADSWVFYKNGPGTVNFQSRIRLLVTLSDLCTEQGKVKEAASYLARAGELFKSDGKPYGQSWNATLEQARASRRISAR